MTLPAVILPKLSKLIPMLSTDQDGELVAAARAIGRALQGVGLDFHDLAHAFDTPRIVERVVYRDRPVPTKPADAPPETWGELAQWLKIRSRKLQQHEADFIRDMAAQAWISREPSEKQKNWMRSLYSKLMRSESGS